MPHSRARFISSVLKRQGKLWPVVGLVGLRQSGKTTIMREQLDLPNYVTFDDDDMLMQATNTPKIFLAQQSLPIVIDEVQKAPKLFNTIKLHVDKDRRPGRFFVTGSSQFSTRIGVRESLTGRIGICPLFPLTIAEALNLPEIKCFKTWTSKMSLRGSWQNVLHHAERGGMPIPMFLRDKKQRNDYWKGWLDTTIHRDLPLCFKSSYKPEIAKSILKTIGRVLREGELPSLGHFNIDSRRLRNYLEAFETIFVLRRIPCHTSGVGKEVWMLGDSGLAAYLMGTMTSDGEILSAVRHGLWQETSAIMSFYGIDDSRSYYKSARGEPIDWVLDGVPMKIVTSLNSRAWSERGLAGAMKSINSKVGFLIAPVDQVELPKNSRGIGVLPWNFWS